MSAALVSASAVRRPVQMFGTSTLVRSRFVSPVAIATGSYRLQLRNSSTARPAPKMQFVENGSEIVVGQRLQRPVAPHLEIYKPQVTWMMSGAHRFSGVMLAGPVYLFAAAYVIAPTVGWHLETQSLAAAFGALPVVAKIGIKTLVATPFTFHCLNGIRHLVWDFGLMFRNKQVIQSGFTVLGLSAIAALGLAFI